MTAAFARGDLDEAVRQGVLAGPAVVEKGLGAASRATQLASILAAPEVTARAELLPALARVATGPDRRVAIPGARAALAIATELADHELPDDLAPDDLVVWRALFEAIGRTGERPIEVRWLALETCRALALALERAGVKSAPVPELDVDQ